MLLLINTALAAWTVAPMAGDLPDAGRKSLEQVLAPCPARQEAWAARFAGGTLARLGPVSGADMVEESRSLEACLRAGLEAAPLPGDVVVTLRYTDTRMDRWREELRSRLDLAVGRTDAVSCTTLRFPIGTEGALGAPAVHASSGDAAFDAQVLEVATKARSGLPPAAKELWVPLGGFVEVCVGGQR